MGSFPDAVLLWAEVTLESKGLRSRRTQSTEDGSRASGSATRRSVATLLLS